METTTWQELPVCAHTQWDAGLVPVNDYIPSFSNHISFTQVTQPKVTRRAVCGTPRSSVVKAFASKLALQISL